MKKMKRNLARRILPILLTALVMGTILPAATFGEELPDTASQTVEELPAAEAEMFSAERTDMAGAGLQAPYTVSRDGVDKLSGYDIYIDPAKTGLNSPDMIFTSTLSPSLGSFELTSARLVNVYDQSVTNVSHAVVFHAPSAYRKGRTYHTEDPDPNKSCYTLRWPNAARDASGKTYDVFLECRYIELEVFADNEPGRNYLVMSIELDSSESYTLWYANRLQGMVAAMHGLAARYTVKVLEHGTDTPAPGTFYFGAQDIDQPDSLAWWKDNSGRPSSDYYEQSPGQPYPYQETSRFYSAPTSPIYLEPNTFLKNDGGEVFYGTRNWSTLDFRAGYVCAAPCSGIDMGWSGSNCGTFLFAGLPANTYSIRAWVEGGVGGQITKDGFTYYYAGQNSDYQMTPAPGWEIEYVKVDGVQIPTTTSYDFNNIQADHAISVKYRRITGGLKLSNDVPMGTLKVTKNIDGTGADTAKAFTFTATALGSAGTCKKYNADGTQVASGAGSGAGTSLSRGGTFTLSGGQYILLSLPAGTPYEIRETADDDYRMSGSPVSGTIRANQDFTYTVNIKDGGANVSDLSMPYTGSKSGTLTTDSDGNAEITLSGGQSVMLTNVPVSFTYTVTQAEVSGFDTAPADRTVTGTKMAEEQTAEFTNTPSRAEASVTNTYHGLGSHYTLTVKKSVTGNMGNRAQEFHFHMTLSKQNVNLQDAVITFQKTLRNGTVQNGSVTLTSGVYDFTLTHGDQIVFTGIPDKTVYAVTEAEENKDQYVTTVDGAASGSLTANTSAQFTNRRQIAIPTKAKIFTIGSIALMFALLTASGMYIGFSVKKKRR